MNRPLMVLSWLLLALALQLPAAQPEISVPRNHPYLLGDRAFLKQLAARKPLDFARVTQIALEREGNEHERIISMALVHAITGDQWCGETALGLVMRYIDGPIKHGHVTFGSDLALCALVFDLCHDLWSEEQKAEFYDYFGRTVDANVNSEASPFHNGYYSYKNWGIGMAALATWHENERSPVIFTGLDRDIRQRAIPSMELAGEGGGWAEGYYVNYWTYKWAFFCEVARRCAGIDYFALSPKFWGNRAVASMFETYPGIVDRGTRRSVPVGDAGGRVVTDERDENLSVRRILVSRFRDDPVHQVVNTFNETTPSVGSSVQVYKDFLWRETGIPQGDLSSFRLSHVSPGAGYVVARSDWSEDATWFFFKCGDRYTAHQNLDNGHFLIYRHAELTGHGGHFYSFATAHEVNYMLRSIAHSTLLVHDPEETWPDIRYHEHIYGTPVVNDGGQHHEWPHHNGAVVDADEWQANRELYDIADLTAFEDRGDWLYLAGDCTRSYKSSKLEYFTRQIVFIRPGTFVIFDRVRSTNENFHKDWLLQAMNVPRRGPDSTLVITNGRGRLFVQTLLPAERNLRLVHGDSLYVVDGRRFEPDLNIGPAPLCRVEISPSEPSETDLFLNVLTATDSTTAGVPVASCSTRNGQISVTLPGWEIEFLTGKVGGSIRVSGGTGKTFIDSLDISY